jgi:hypothetical protein
MDILDIINVALVPVGYPARAAGETERVSKQDAVAMIV